MEIKMTETTLLVLVLLLLVGCFFVVYYYDRKLVKAIAEYEKRMDEKGILKDISVNQQHNGKNFSFSNSSNREFK